MKINIDDAIKIGKIGAQIFIAMRKSGVKTISTKDVEDLQKIEDDKLRRIWDEAQAKELAVAREAHAKDLAVAPLKISDD